jgi:hypothetical protein
MGSGIIKKPAGVLFKGGEWGGRRAGAEQLRLRAPELPDKADAHRPQHLYTQGSTLKKTLSHIRNLSTSMSQAII